jgi:hypothetical protein
MIFAAVFFNVYEYTDWGKRISIAVGWRSRVPTLPHWLHGCRALGSLALFFLLL